MIPELQVGSVLVRELPHSLGLKTVPYSGSWSMVEALDGFALDRKIRAAGWNFFFIASEVRVKFHGTPGGEAGKQKVERAVNRILRKVSAQHFNSLEVTGIAARRILGVSYVFVSAHSRHIQPGCYLDGSEARRTSQHDAAWARR
jgi:hypothetical protein